MKNQHIPKLENEENINDWNEIYNKIDSQIKEYKEKNKNLDTIQVNNEEEKDEYLGPNAKVDLNELNVEQAIQRGDKLHDSIDQALDNMNEHVIKDKRILHGANEKLTIDKKGNWM